ncbi:unnamed protein product [Brachionus calyciflorus]|uniref:Large ribosomal subunit protein eL14 n=1 Tax=Brachionus calyciflorus TaxID=104777 RepID=A0A813TCB8_9BILA|nr:unnamed protein product [Brachionus calyciflorus]
MTYTKFVQVGRVAYVAFGPEQGKLVTIVDIIDQNRVLVDGPNFRRQALNLKTLYLTKHLIKIQHSARAASVKAAWAKAEIDKKWAESNWAKRLAAKQVRTNLTDFDRFKLMKAKQTRNRLIALEVGKLRIKSRKAAAEAKKAGKK